MVYYFIIYIYIYIYIYGLVSFKLVLLLRAWVRYAQAMRLNSVEAHMREVCAEASLTGVRGATCAGNVS